MKWNLKLKAGALQFVLFIGVVIAILLLTFVTLSYTHSFFGKKTDLLIQTIKKTDLGLAYAMQQDLVLNDTLPLKLGIDDPIETKVIKNYWGIFEKYTVVASFQKSKFTKTALVGAEYLKDSPALYLKDINRPMVIAGNTKIVGDAFLPKQGIRTGNISGNSYFQKQLLYGQQKISISELPKLDAKLQENLNKLTSSQSYGVGEAISLPNGTEFALSFHQETQFVYGDVISLSNLKLTGNIIINASRKIIVQESAILQDVILIAPEIIIKDKVLGTFQAIASKTIEVGKNCQLNYPSALVVNSKNESQGANPNQQNANISIEQNTTVSGVVLYLGSATDQQFYPQIKIDDMVTIIGELYCEEALELKGEVLGSVTTAMFMALENGSIYKNHLYNGQINAPLLSNEYVGLLYDENRNKKKVSKWLY
ncbi:hypothetical protein [Cellulophaga sp. Hel_I_12]|uniref:hypothetical protein n=1 Tax=Cellulophaga sp. Hel_I_12 TaxID=1249972 RepID=UPI000645B67B|nr:hypothetical protein [Cellulophaga sp. Hel_I_12]